MTYIPKDNFEFTQFNEAVVSTRNSSFAIKPTWGISFLRESLSFSGTGAGGTEEGGEIKLSTGPDVNSYVSTTTLERGVYVAGASGQVGLGVRLPVAPVSTQYAEWGYTDGENGFGYGVDSSGMYIFYKHSLSGSTKVYQDSWNVDKMSGNTEGSSGYQLDLARGNIFQVDFVWYGYGTISYTINIFDSANNIRKKVEVHRLNVHSSVSVVDPNQPITVSVHNGSGATTNLDVFIGGRQFSIIGGSHENEKRKISEVVNNFSLTSATGVWQSVMSIKKKENFGISNRENSINTLIKNVQVITNQNIEFALCFSGATTGTPSGWSTPSYWVSSETSVETKVSSGSMTHSLFGYPFMRGIVSTASKNFINEASKSLKVFLHKDIEVVLFMRNLTASSAVISAILEWEEEW